jgi:hypothetical protein
MLRMAGMALQRHFPHAPEQQNVLFANFSHFERNFSPSNARNAIFPVLIYFVFLMVLTMTFQSNAARLLRMSEALENLQDARV